MQVIDGSSQVVIIGNFDGVHRGHQALIREGVLMARRRSAQAVLLTFDPHPQHYFSKGLHLRLEPVSQVKERCEYWGLDDVFVQPFAPPFADLEAERFLNEFLLKKFKPVGLVVGFDFRFGKGRKGDGALLRNWAEDNRIQLRIVEPVLWQSEKISSSRIREMLARGEVKLVPDLLGRPFSIAGPVVPGAQRGSQIGFPTANIKLEGLVVPADGVYFTRAILGEKSFWSVTHIGSAPTVGRAERVIECHLLNYSSGPLYGQSLEVQFIDHIRGVQKFGSLEELRTQIQKDIQKGQELQS